MCLIIEKRDSKWECPKKGKIATKDITVYKCITKNGLGRWNHLKDENGDIMLWKKGYHYTEIDKIQIFNSWSFYEIDSGAFHSKKKIIDAKGLSWRNHKVVKMIIPKGCRYWENKTDYASKELIYLNDL